MRIEKCSWLSAGRLALEVDLVPCASAEMNVPARNDASDVSWKLQEFQLDKAGQSHSRTGQGVELCLTMVRISNEPNQDRS